MSTENELLVVSFGTTSAESRRLSIDPVEQAIQAAVGDSWTVRRCFTSQKVIDIIAEREGIRIDSVEEAIERAVADGIKNLVVQPTHFTSGLEYDKLICILEENSGRFVKTAHSDPLLTSEADIEGVACALIEASCAYEDGKTALIFMGHGTEAAANGIYENMQDMLRSKGKKNYYVGTVEAEPSLDDVIDAVKAGDYRRVILRPLMLVAGNHAVNDMASKEDPDSWYSRFTAAGYETICVIEGLGQLASVRDIYAAHAHRAVAALTR